MQEVLMVMGFPASGKTTFSDAAVKQGHVHLNRDKIGGNIDRLLPLLNQHLLARRSVILDNLFPTKESRKQFLLMAKKHNVPVNCTEMETSIEDAIINALHRMWQKHGRIFYDAQDLKKVPKDPNMFPIAVFFKYRKEYERPTKGEGFTSIKTAPFKRVPRINHKEKAVLFDYDGTLRISTGKQPYPTKPSEVKIMDERREKLQQLHREEGYILLGVSNQSGIAKGIVTDK